MRAIWQWMRQSGCGSFVRVFGGSKEPPYNEAGPQDPAYIAAIL
jgi:hypothetical protein